MNLAAWTWEPGVVLGLGACAMLYARGWRRWARRSHAPPSAWRALAFASGSLLVLVALLSPIGTYDQQSFALHMLQHMLLVVGAAPLLLLGMPLVSLLWGLPDQERRGVGRLLRADSPLHALGTALGQPVVAASLFLGTFGAWHIPALYDAAQGRTLVHDLEHGLFLGTALVYWWPVLHAHGSVRRLGLLAAVAYLVPAMLEGMLLGAWLTFSPQPLYATYRASAGWAGVPPLVDQQLAGLIMWVPSGLVYLAAILAALDAALREQPAAT